MNEIKPNQVLEVAAEQLIDRKWSPIGKNLYKGGNNPIVAALLGLVDIDGIDPIDTWRGIPVGTNGITKYVRSLISADPARSPFEVRTSYFTLRDLETVDWETFIATYGEIEFAVHTMTRLRERAENRFDDVRIIVWMADVETASRQLHERPHASTR